MTDVHVHALRIVAYLFLKKCCAKTNSMKTANIVCLRTCCHIFISQRQSINFIHFIYAYCIHTFFMNAHTYFIQLHFFSWCFCMLNFSYSVRFSSKCNALWTKYFLWKMGWLLFALNSFPFFAEFVSFWASDQYCVYNSDLEMQSPCVDVVLRLQWINVYAHRHMQATDAHAHYIGTD